LVTGWSGSSGPEFGGGLWKKLNIFLRKAFVIDIAKIPGYNRLYRNNSVGMTAADLMPGPAASTTHTTSPNCLQETPTQHPQDDHEVDLGRRHGF
jgi:hypothetical protein